MLPAPHHNVLWQEAAIGLHPQLSGASIRSCHIGGTAAAVHAAGVMCTPRGCHIRCGEAPSTCAPLVPALSQAISTLRYFIVSNNLTNLPIYLWGASSGGTLALKMMGQLYRFDQQVGAVRPGLFWSCRQAVLRRRIAASRSMCKEAVCRAGFIYGCGGAGARTVRQQG